MWVGVSVVVGVAVGISVAVDVFVGVGVNVAVGVGVWVGVFVGCGPGPAPLFAAIGRYIRSTLSSDRAAEGAGVEVRVYVGVNVAGVWARTLLVSWASICCEGAAMNEISTTASKAIKNGRRLFMRRTFLAGLDEVCWSFNWN